MKINLKAWLLGTAIATGATTGAVTIDTVINTAEAACYETCQSKCRMNWRANFYNSQADCVADWSKRNEDSGSSARIRAQRADEQERYRSRPRNQRE